MSEQKPAGYIVKVVDRDLGRVSVWDGDESSLTAWALERIADACGGQRR